MESPSGMTHEPRLDLGVFVGGVVIEDHVDILVSGHVALDDIEKADELLMTVALHVAADDPAIEDIQGGKQCGGSVALVIVGHGATAPLLHRQSGLGAVEGLDLALFIHGQHHGMGRRVHIQTNHIPEFVGKDRIIGELEQPPAMGLSQNQ